MKLHVYLCSQLIFNGVCVVQENVCKVKKNLTPTVILVREGHSKYLQPTSHWRMLEFLAVPQSTCYVILHTGECKRRFALFASQAKSSEFLVVSFDVLQHRISNSLVLDDRILGQELGVGEVAKSRRSWDGDWVDGRCSLSLG